MRPDPAPDPTRRIVRRASALIVALVLAVAAAQNGAPLVVAQGTDVASLDPQMQNDAFSTSVLSNVFDTLVYRDADLELVPGLATAWRSVDDTTWELELRQGVTFHDGSTFGPEDVEFTLERPLDEALGSPLASRFAVIDDVEVTGPDTVRVHTVDPYPLLPARLSEWFVVSKAYVEANDQATLSAQPVGTGAYRFVEWVKDDHLTLEAYEDHWRGAPEIEAVTFRPIPELATRTAALQAGDVDLVTNVPAIRTEAIDADPDLEVRSVPSTYIQYVALDGTKNEALADVRVRKALQYATNVDEIIEFIFDGNAVKIAVPLAHGTFGLNEGLEPYPYDPERARELLAEAGVEPGELTLEFIAPTGRYVQDFAAAQAIANFLREVGVDTEVRTMDWPSYVGTIVRPSEDQDVEMHLLGWAPSFMDASQQMQQFLTSQHPPNGLATSFYDNPEVDRLVDAANQETDPERRAELYAEASRLVWEDAPWIFLWVQRFPMVHAADVTNVWGLPNEKFYAIYARPAE